MKIQKYVAELLGTFFLTLAVYVSVMMGMSLGTAVVAGLTLGLFVYTIGGVSGGHFNPAVTIGMATVKKVSTKDAVVYIIFQVVGALLAMLVGQNLVTPAEGVALVADEMMTTGVVEALGTFVLAFGVAAVTFGKVGNSASGLTIGGSLALGTLLAAGWTNALLNPAIAVALGSLSWMYVLGPVVGAVVAAWVYRFVVSK